MLMRFMSVLSVFGLALLTMSPAGAEDGVEVRIDEKSPALHMIVGKQSVFAVPAFEDYMEMFFDLCDAMELKIGGECQIYPMNAEIGLNAIATEQEGNRLIVYDRRLSPEVGYEGAMMIIAHELGHHYCHHLGKLEDPNLELEADRFAGAAMRNAGHKLDDALAAVHILDERPSKSHPARADRIAAITEGWNQPSLGKQCR